VVVKALPHFVTWWASLSQMCSHSVCTVQLALETGRMLAHTGASGLVSFQVTESVTRFEPRTDVAMVIVSSLNLAATGRQIGGVLAHRRNAQLES
jgi:hypothetical protein